MGLCCSKSKNFAIDEHGHIFRTSGRASEFGSEVRVRRALKKWDYPYDLESWKSCCTIPPGNEQSPIDLPESLNNLASSFQFKPNYTTVPIVFTLNGLPGNLLDNGRTIQMNVEEGQTLTRLDNGAVYDLLQFHFHTTSEHTVNHRSYPLEMHLVHQLQGSDDLLVLGIFFDTDNMDEESNEFLESFWDYLPGDGCDTSVDDVQVHLSSLASAIAISSFYNYSGSLTTPPLSEGVTWIVAKEPLKCTKGQVLRFRQRSGQNGNFRPPQPLGKRNVYRAEMVSEVN